MVVDIFVKDVEDVFLLGLKKEYIIPRAVKIYYYIIVNKRIKMKQEYLDKLEKANSLIFEVEQELKKEKSNHEAHTLRIVRIEINNVKNNIRNNSG